MGVIRGGLLIIVVAILFLVLLIGGLLLSLSISLSYENVRPELNSFIKGIINKGLATQADRSAMFNSITTSCENKSEISFMQQGYVLNIPCNITEQGLDSIIDYSVDGLVDKIYYGSYDCGFWNCFIKIRQPFFLVSEKAKDYWSSKLYLFFIAFIILVILTFLLCERKTNFLMISGILIFISGLPLMKISLFSSLLGATFQWIFYIFFSKAANIGLIMIVLGVILVLLGIALKIGFHDWVKRKFSKQEVKEIVKEEISKVKKEEKIKQEKQQKSDDKAIKDSKKKNK